MPLLLCPKTTDDYTQTPIDYTHLKDDYTQTPPNSPEYATIISLNTNKNKDHSYRTEATIHCRSRSPSADKEQRKISPLISPNLELLENSAFSNGLNVYPNRSKSPSPISDIHDMTSTSKSPPTPPPMRNSSASNSNAGSRRQSGHEVDHPKTTHFPSIHSIKSLSRDMENKSSSSRSASGKFSSSSKTKVARNCVEPDSYGLPHNGYPIITNSRGKHGTKVYTISHDQESDESHGTGKNSPDPFMLESKLR